jgi:16S rRNA (cytidine1402-2'-O)-methyltransferase
MFEPSMSHETFESALYIVATPIGNLQDISQRTIHILSKADFLLAEDTRRTQRLLNHLGLHVPMIPFHEHNQIQKTPWVIEQLKAEKIVALVSDAGTPGISDPGQPLVKEVREQGFKVLPIPGPCAAIVAASISGFNFSRFWFEGFLPAKQKARMDRLFLIQQAPCPVIAYEAPHRIVATLEDCLVCLPEHQIFLARELTKCFETHLKGTACELLSIIKQDPNQELGEFVIIIQENVKKVQNSIDEEAENWLPILERALGISAAAKIMSLKTGGSKKIYYDWLLAQKSSDLDLSSTGGE